ncbi:hypothetical protein FH972_024948 [Carpinus fangiana]|uniref:F-box domain-containing protein n=1 Tax=Carpinus fangiana TaxID=176857 RepID=A0A5N6L0H4_9ROSI|nr:hypothetical protein FH972_024948 [Carpinus fangiana]
MDPCEPLPENDRAAPFASSLPMELLVQIFAHLDTSDIVSMAQVCQRHRDLAQSILFKDIVIRYQSGLPTLDIHRATLLLRTLLRRPELALACKALRVEMMDVFEPFSNASPELRERSLGCSNRHIIDAFEPFTNAPPRPQLRDLDLATVHSGTMDFFKAISQISPQPPLLDDHDLDAARCLIRRIRPHALVSWITALQASTASAIIALILCCMTRLNRLHLTIDTNWDRDFITDLFIDLAFLKRKYFIFEDLREVKYHREIGRERGSGHPFHPLAPKTGEHWIFFQLENLMCFNTSIMEPHTGPNHVPTLGQILKDTPNLESLAYDFHYDRDNHDSRLANFESGEIGRALQYVKSSLRHLFLSCKCTWLLVEDEGLSNNMSRLSFSWAGIRQHT